MAKEGDYQKLIKFLILDLNDINFYNSHIMSALLNRFVPLFWRLRYGKDKKFKNSKR